MKEKPNSKKPMIYYGIIAMVGLLLINIFILPMLTGGYSTETVSYDTFLADLNDHKIQEVLIDDDAKTITWSTNEPSKGRLVSLYQTGLVSTDTGLVDRLTAAGVTFSSAIPARQSIWSQLFFSLILPMLFFVLVGQLLMRSMQKRMGGSGASAIRVLAYVRILCRRR